MIEQNIEDLGWSPINPSYDWVKYGLRVIGERYLENGRRQHLVAGEVLPGLVLDNADIFSETDAHKKAHTKTCPRILKTITTTPESYIEVDITIISKQKDGSVKLRFQDLITSKPHTTTWSKIKSKNGGECVVSGERIGKGVDVYRPDGGVPYRSKRILANLVDELI